MVDQELRIANEELEVISKELRTTSEELEAAYKELQTINEELETKKQELKATNEKLETIKADARCEIVKEQVETLKQKLHHQDQELQEIEQELRLTNRELYVALSGQSLTLAQAKKLAQNILVSEQPASQSLAKLLSAIYSSPIGTDELEPKDRANDQTPLITA